MTAKTPQTPSAHAAREIACDILIVGAGLVGMATALACAYTSPTMKIVLLDGIDPYAGGAPEPDGRAYAIAASGYQMLRRLDVIARLSTPAQAMANIEISDGHVGSLSPLTLYFEGQTIARDPADSPDDTLAMGYMIENYDLKTACLDAVSACESITLLAPVKLDGYDTGGGQVRAGLSDGRYVRAACMVAADGRNSRLRRMAGIGVQGWPYRQKALTTTITHSVDHAGLAREIFFPAGPLALLPLHGQRSHIVWTDTPPAIDAALALDPQYFVDELARRIDGLLGDITVDGPINAFPLGLQMADRYAADRLVLVGDAAHIIHPIAGQGLNMGLRDGAALADIIASAKAVGLDIGGAALSDYGAWRNLDNTALAASTDLFNRVFSNNIKPVKHARRLALGALNLLPSPRQFLMREAAGQTGDIPSLLR